MADAMSPRATKESAISPQQDSSTSHKQAFWAQVIGRLTAAYPHAELNVAAQMMYWEALCEFEVADVAQAVKKLIYDDERYERFRPGPGPIRRMTKELVRRRECERDGLDPETGLKIWRK